MTALLTLAEAADELRLSLERRPCPPVDKAVDKSA